MLEDIRIKNFRCFQDATIRPLKRVNLFAGKSNVGKTSLLEAVFLLIGHHNPELSIRINAWRGVTSVASQPEEVWGWLFLDKHVEKPIEISASDHEKKRVCLRIRLEEPTETQLGSSDLAEAATPAATGVSAIVGLAAHLFLDLSEGDELKAVAVAEAWLENNAIRTKQGQKRCGDVVFLPCGRISPNENAERFSKLAVTKRTDEVLDALQLLEPRLMSVQVYVTGGDAFVAGDIGLSEVVPLYHMGQGTNRLLSMLNAILVQPQGVVLIDEFENGLHYSVLKDVWKVIANASKRSETQVFATTHSWECLKAAHDAFRELGDDDFCLHRLERRKDGISPVVLELDTLETAIASELEVR